MLRQSGGDLDTLRDLKEQEVDRRIYPVCREGICWMLPDRIKTDIKMAFERRDSAALDEIIGGITEQ